MKLWLQRFHRCVYENLPLRRSEEAKYAAIARAQRCGCEERDEIGKGSKMQRIRPLANPPQNTKQQTQKEKALPASQAGGREPR